MNSTKKCARIIATCFKPKRVVEKTLLTGSPLGFYYHSQKFTNTDEIIDLIKFNIKLEKKIHHDYELDLIIVNSDIGSEKGNDFIDSIDGENLSTGSIKVLHRNNIGLSFGAYSDAFKKYRNQYDYFIFTEDDLSIKENNYVKKSIEIFQSHENIGFLAFVGKTKISKGHWKDLNISKKEEAYSCHGAAGLSSSMVLGEVYDKYGMLPHNADEEYFSGITFGEVALPLSITRLGYKLIDQPKDMYFAVPSYDLMRDIEIKKFPNIFEKFIFYSKSLIYKVFTSNTVAKEIYFYLLGLRDKKNNS